MAALRHRRGGAGRGRFQVGYLSAISVLPEASTLRIVLNGAEIGRTAVDGARGLRRETVTIPPGALRPGFNAVTIAVDQRHRVDCSVPATYELWTQIDPDTTGLVAAGRGSPTSPIFPPPGRGRTAPCRSA
nr:cellulose biosynthesis cyclic di-GMP-binding regulatory protein BcsB [Methylobacterium aquaticum]